MKVHIAPQWPLEDRGDGGVRRVYEALTRYLPDYGITPVDDPDDADLINCHALTLVTRPGVPMVASCHGLHWAEDRWPRWAARVNRDVREVLMQAEAWTAPSEWVRTAMTRGMAIDPTVIYHGVEIPAAVQPSEGYILWNKTRVDAACDPAVIKRLAELLPDRTILTTHYDGAAPANVHVTGKMPHAEMLDHVARAGVYLATTRETFGIGTIEALAAGVPVVGYDFGGQREIVIQGETGLLVPPGNVEALAQAIQSVELARERFAENAREDAVRRWQWPDKIARYAELFRRVYAAYREPRPKVSIIVPFRNTGKYLPDTVKSVQAQSLTDWEMVIIDDASEPEEAEIAVALALSDPRIQYNRATENIRPSRARNWAAKLARGRYVMPLDSDDMLAPNALRVLADALDRDRSIHLAYGHLDLMGEDGSGRRRGAWPTAEFDWHGQAAKRNQLPYCPMMRREVLERTGGYRRRERSVEDAGLWLRATSVGFRAKKVTEASVLHYRLRPTSWSREGGQEQDWTAWIAWRNGSATPPWGAQGDPLQDFWPVSHHEEPLVSIVIPVGPGHEGLLADALDSVFYSQRARQWECIVVNDTGRPWGGPHEWGSPVQGAAWARVIDNDGPKGVASARNAGWRAARAPLVLFLDADDYLLPNFLEDTLRVQSRTGGIVYTDALIARADGVLEAKEFPEFDRAAVLDKMQHANTVLIPKAALEDIGGIDESLRGWEDWDMFIALRAAGWCSDRVARPGFVYRHTTGQRREESLERKPEVLEQFRGKWGHLLSGEVDLMACGCSKGTPVAYAGAAPTPRAASFDGQLYTLVEYIGEEQATRSWTGRVSGVRYRFAATPDRRVVPVDNRDLSTFQQQREFVVRGA